MAEKMTSNDRASFSPMPSGEVGNNPFDDQARRGFEQYSHTFGKYVTSNEDGKEFSEEEKEKRDRAKKANKIYKSVCEDLDLKACFFNNFVDWSAYIDGRMSESDFRTRAVERARETMLEN